MSGPLPPVADRKLKSGWGNRVPTQTARRIRTHNFGRMHGKEVLKCPSEHGWRSSPHELLLDGGEKVRTVHSADSDRDLSRVVAHPSNSELRYFILTS